MRWNALRQAVTDKMGNPAHIAINLLEQGLVPDRLVRQSIRWLIRRRLATLPRDDEAAASAERAFVALMDEAPVAPLPEKANEQHYELPPAFFERCLGARRKYSCCYWPPGVDSLDAAEVAALESTCKRAGLADGQDVLELGCGWGSLTLWMAERYPQSRITAVSNSRAQRRYIETRAAELGLSNVDVQTHDMNDFDTQRQFDRIVSVEMFEHMRNYRELFARLASWMRPGALFFMHIFCHRSTPYLFEDRGATDWMSRHFFSGGIMPSDTLPLNFQQQLALRDRWRWSGTHYAKTADAWLQRMDDEQSEIMKILSETYGDNEAPTWWTRWRMFYLAVSELFGYDDGRQWWVSHYLFEKPVQA